VTRFCRIRVEYTQYIYNCEFIVVVVDSFYIESLCNKSIERKEAENFPT